MVARLLNQSKNPCTHHQKPNATKKNTHAARVDEKVIDIEQAANYLKSLTAGQVSDATQVLKAYEGIELADALRIRLDTARNTYVCHIGEDTSNPYNYIHISIV